MNKQPSYNKARYRKRGVCFEAPDLLLWVKSELELLISWCCAYTQLLLSCHGSLGACDGSLKFCIYYRKILKKTWVEKVSFPVGDQWLLLYFHFYLTLSSLSKIKTNKKSGFLFQVGNRLFSREQTIRSLNFCSVWRALSPLNILLIPP